MGDYRGFPCLTRPGDKKAANPFAIRWSVSSIDLSQYMKFRLSMHVLSYFAGEGIFLANKTSLSQGGNGWDGAPGRSRTGDREFRRLVLYPTELPARDKVYFISFLGWWKKKMSIPSWAKVVKGKFDLFIIWPR